MALFTHGKNAHPHERTKQLDRKHYTKNVQRCCGYKIHVYMTTNVCCPLFVYKISSWNAVDTKAKFNNDISMLLIFHDSSGISTFIIHSLNKYFVVYF